MREHAAQELDAATAASSQHTSGEEQDAYECSNSECGAKYSEFDLASMGGVSCCVKCRGELKPIECSDAIDTAFRFKQMVIENIKFLEEGLQTARAENGWGPSPETL